MIRDFLDPVKLGIIECLFEKIERGATIKEIQISLPRNTKYPERNLRELQEEGIVVCENPEAPVNEQKFIGNSKSKVFVGLFTVDIELSELEHERKKKLRAAMLASMKKG